MLIIALASQILVRLYVILVGWECKKIADKIKSVKKSRTLCKYADHFKDSEIKWPHLTDQ